MKYRNACDVLHMDVYILRIAFYILSHVASTKTLVSCHFIL